MTGCALSFGLRSGADMFFLLDHVKGDQKLRDQEGDV